MNTLTQTLNLTNQNQIQQDQNIGQKQNKFLDTMLGKAINTGINLGIRALLPNFIEDQVISLKDTLIKEGLGATIKQAINSTIDLGKSVIGIATGHFDNLNQARNVVRNGGIIDTISGGLSFALNLANRKGLIPENVKDIINGGKEIIADSIKSNIESEFEDQFRKVITLNKNIERWNDYYEQRDFEGIRRETNNIQRNIKALFPIETTIKEARKIENLYKIIERKGGDFNLSEEEINLAKRLVY